MNKWWTGVAVLAFAVLCTVTALAAEEKKSDRPGGMMVEAVSITTTIEKIDPKTREITLKGPKGGLTTFIAGDEVKRFNELKKGDQVTFDYTEGIAIDIRKATEAPKMVETQSIQRTKPTEKPGGTVESLGFLTARVEDIDYQSRKVKLLLPEGQHLQFTAGDQVKRLNEIYKGDEVVVEYSQKLSIKVTSPKAK